MSDNGLTIYQINIIKRILHPFANKIHSVGLFGSRAKGTYRENSDIDMVIYGSLNEEDVDRIWTLFDASDLPVRVDLNVYHLIAYPPLKRHIDAVVQPLFSQQELLGLE